MKKMTLGDFLNEFDFGYYTTINEDGEKVFKLVDYQEANLGGIEEEEFSSAEDVVDRLDIYYDDYILNPLYDEERSGIVEEKLSEKEKDILHEVGQLIHHNHSFQEVYDELCKVKNSYFDGYRQLLYYCINANELIVDEKDECKDR